MGCYRFKEVYVLNVFMVFVLEYVIIVFRSLKPRDSNPLALQLGLTAAFRLYLLYVLLLYSSRIIAITLISSSYVNNTMSPNIEVECSKPVKGDIGLLSRRTHLIALTSITIVSHTYAEAPSDPRKRVEYEHAPRESVCYRFKGVLCV